MLNSQKKGQSRNRKEIRQIFAKTKDVQTQAMLKVLEQSDLPQKYINVASRKLAAAQDVSHSFWSRIKFMFQARRNFCKKTKATQTSPTFKQKLALSKSKDLQNMTANFRKNIEEEIFKEVNQYLDQIENSENTSSVTYVRNSFSFRRASQNNRRPANESSEPQQQLLIKAFQLEYSFIADQLDKSVISRPIADQLNQSVSTDQMMYMQNLSED